MMKTRWKNWQATFGKVTARYEAKRDWAEGYMRLIFYLYIRFEIRDHFYVMVKDWVSMDVVDPKMLGSLEEALEYLSDVNCEDYVDEKWEKLRKDY